MRRVLFAFSLSWILLLPPTLPAATIHVPADHPTIQAGIDAAVDGDTVLVSPGVYRGKINFLGKAIIVRSTDGAAVTTIDALWTGSVVTFQSGETGASIIDGFTIRRGRAWGGGGIVCRLSSSPRIENCTITRNIADDFGGGIYCVDESSPVIVNCTITSNRAAIIEMGRADGIYVGGHGAGICCQNESSPSIMNCSISRNYALAAGGGIHCMEDSSPMIANCDISGNVTGGVPFYAWGGGGIGSTGSAPIIVNSRIYGNISLEEGGGVRFNYSSSPVISNSVIARNTALFGGGGITVRGDSEVLIENSILWANKGIPGPEISLGKGKLGTSRLSVRYSNVLGGEDGVYMRSCSELHWHEGNIDTDPRFVDEVLFELAFDSPCIDTGEPEAAYDDECFPPSLGAERNDMGAYGGPGACDW